MDLSILSDWFLYPSCSSVHWSLTFYSSRVRSQRSEEEYMRTMYILRTDDRPTDLAFCKTSNGHISATGHLIHFMFGSMVGFSRSADRMDLLPMSPNPRWRLAAILENFEWPYLWNELSDPLSWITEQLWRNTGENNARGVIRLVTI